MCGFNGVFHFHSSLKKEGVLQKMNQQIAQRGPDAEGYYTDEIIELGHRRLSIIDTSEESNQPIFSEDNNFVLVYNGELYNYLELKNQLHEYPYKTKGDSEVIIAAFKKWGIHALRAFNGIFSFAIWDKSKRELWLVRDRLGIKPLYYLSNNKQVVFSSSLKAILNSGYSTKQISKSSLHDYLRYQTVHAPETIIEDIHVMMPGHYAKITEDDGMQISAYWSLQNISTKKITSKSEAINLVHDQLSKSVSMQMVADVPFGAFLSGGIDSSLMVALMSKQSGSSINTFSVIFKEDKFSEREFAKLVSSKYGTTHHEIELSVDEFKELLPSALKAMDHPSGDGPNTFVVSKKTQEQGIKMAISGLGGDELFGGYSVFNQIPSLRQKKWIRSFPGYARRPLGKIYKQIKQSVAADKIGSIIALDNYDIEDIYQYYRQVFSDEMIFEMMGSKKLSNNKVWDIVNAQIGYKMDGWHLEEWSKISVAEMSTYMQNVLLRDTDQMSMAHSLEVRVPFLDHELVELVIGMPDFVKKGDLSKNLLIDSFKDELPQEVYNRPKMGFTLPYEVWMKNDLKSFCEEHLNYLKNTSLFDEKIIDKLWIKFLKSNKRVTWSRIWILVVLGFWLKENNVNG